MKQLADLVHTWQDKLLKLNTLTDAHFVMCFNDEVSVWAPKIISSNSLSVSQQDCLHQKLSPLLSIDSYASGLLSENIDITPFVHFSSLFFPALYNNVFAVFTIDDDSKANSLLFSLLVSQFESDLLAITANDTVRDQNFIVQEVIDSFDEHIWIKSTDGYYLSCNHSAEKTWKKSKFDIIGKTDHQIFDKRTADLFIESDKHAISAGKSIIVAECEDFDLSTNKVWLETVKSPIYRAGKAIGVLGFTWNIAKHKAAEEQLMLAACVFENSLEGVIITDAEGLICNVNQAFTDITGYQLDEVKGKSPSMLSSGRHSKSFFSKMWNTLLVFGKWHGEIWNRRKNGAVFPQAITISAVYDQDNSVKFFVGIFADISLLKQTEEKLKNLAYVDPLTNLPNRMQFVTNLEQEINHAARNNKQLAVLCVDIDFFKNINESLGHLIGDDIIVELSKRLSFALSDFDILARLGSDEFVVLLPNISGTDSVLSSISQLRRVFERPFIVDNSPSIRLTASIGISIYPNDGVDANGLLRNVDAAMHRAKLNGRNSYAFYNESMTIESIEQLKLQSALHQAIINNDFYLVYQPKINLSNGQTQGFEALIRWTDSVLGNIPPSEFIPLAEKIGLINDIGLWVLKTACIQGVNWLAQGNKFSRISVNVASLQLQQSDFVDKVKQILLTSGLSANYLDFEITESCMMNNQAEVIKDLKQLSAMGITISIDDFGTGYSSLNYLKKLPLNILKIDQSFVRDIPTDVNNTAIAKAIIALGHALNLQIIAEGVETEEQATFLRDSGCDFAQGYLYSKPKLAADLDDFF
ncbi:sensor domain-containing protein [Shewanella sp. OMA3-2]|uniref:sensor domain-containing protein n=1 Tax=Shewanella sp. OMA3-2 TaxID=2908650 RepID=UPI001F1CE23F|nr:EAL domain-containing protein [Shewanella sp. OMA3-2]UJF23321.1 EAL domain-containing protein [Shewanella sp. OMA3-2]